MSGIDWIYMVDNSGAPILLYERGLQNRISKRLTISHFLLDLHMVSGEFDKSEVKSIQIYDDIFFIIDVKENNSFFVLKTLFGANKDKIPKILSEIRDEFIIKFKNEENLAVQKKQELFISFKEEIKEILTRSNNSSTKIKMDSLQFD